MAYQIPKCSPDARHAYRVTTEPVLRKEIAARNIIFNPATAEKVIDVISDNFFVSDDEEKGCPVYYKISDTEIGILFSEKGYTLDELLTETKAIIHIDNEATRIAQLSHRGKLRQNAIAMLPTNAGPEDIENMTAKLEGFELRDLRAGRIQERQDMRQIDAEFAKLRVSKGLPRGGARTTVNGNNEWDSLSSITKTMQSFGEPDAFKRFIDSKKLIDNTSKNITTRTPTPTPGIRKGASTTVR